MTLDDLQKIAAAEEEAQRKVQHDICVCNGTACQALHSEKLIKTLQQEIASRGLEQTCRVRGVGCPGVCALAPVVMVDGERTLYRGVEPQHAPGILESLGRTPVKQLESPTDTPFFKRQQKIVLEHAGKIDPDRIEEYIAAGGYTALVKALTEMTSQDVIVEVTNSGLRGRGGAGFPTGLKWSTVRKAVGNRKFVICNGDEGDPGAFMDRSVMESVPHAVLEGMAIAGYAVGASQGYIYVRAEYPLAVKRLKNAIRQATQLGALGNDICGTAFNFHIEIRLGAGAFVCGEETALVASVEGKRGNPRPRPPFPAEEGLWEAPTLINNVETFANIAPIVTRGGGWYAQIGTEKSKGTKVFALTGRVKNTGLIEVPMGITLREIVFEVGGGIPDGKKFKAVQTGGPSGGCIPEQFLDMPVDYESLRQAGSIMGSGGMIVMDETSCMVDVARFFMEFCKTESCGKCVPCSVGTAHMYDLLAKITTGVATDEDLALLEQLCEMVQATSLCGLGQTAPNPVISTLRFFRDEYLAHIKDKKCPAGVCQMRRAAEVKA